MAADRTRRGPGRPPGDPLARRTCGIRVRLTRDELDALHVASDAEGVPIAEQLRDLGLRWAARATKSGGD